jgi:hypothetical protein
VHEPPEQRPGLSPTLGHIELLQHRLQQALQELPPQSVVPAGQEPAVQEPLLQTPGLSPTLGQVALLQHWLQQALQLLPPQSLVPPGQLYWQVPALHTPVLSPLDPQCASEQHSLQVPSPHRCRVPLHLRSHLVPSQVAVALGEVGQEVHDVVPQELTLLLSRHSLLHRWEPARQVKSQLVPSHVACPFIGGLQGMHEVPQLAGSLFDTQLPLQSCVPTGHTPSQAIASGMHAPLQILVFAGQVAPQLVPSQVAEPPVGTGQGVQPTPQLAVSVFLAHPSPQAW